MVPRVTLQFTPRCIASARAFFDSRTRNFSRTRSRETGLRHYLSTSHPSHSCGMTISSPRVPSPRRWSISRMVRRVLEGVYRMDQFPAVEMCKELVN